MTRPPDDDGPPPVDDFASSVLDVVDSIPPGRVMSYGDIAEYLGAGPGPRQVGRVMAVYGGAVAWWRVIHADGTPAPGHDSVAVRHYLAEGTPLRSARPPVRADKPQKLRVRAHTSILAPDTPQTQLITECSRNDMNGASVLLGPRDGGESPVTAVHQERGNTRGLRTGARRPAEARGARGPKLEARS